MKRFLEMRGADGGPWRRICALPAFWVGLLYDDEALGQADALTRDWTLEEVEAMRNTAPRPKGLDTGFRNRKLNDVAREILRFPASVSPTATGSIKKARRNGLPRPAREAVARGTTSAQEMLRAFNTRWGGSIEPVFLEYAY